MRTDSIYSKLERADKKGGTTYFLDLMIFLEEATGDRFGKGAELVREWGFKTSKTALFDGYAVASSLWCLDRARSFAQSTEDLSALDAETRRLIGQKTFQLIANQPDPKVLLGFAKLEVEKIKADATIRRVKLLEDKMAEARALVSGAKAKGKGGFTPETLKAIEEKLSL